MPNSELTDSNYKRISLINWFLTPAMLILFAWPYYLVSNMIGLQELISILGALFFASPFAMTILHGHVTMAVGALHRDNYYKWLNSRPLSYGLLFHPIMFRTRFRLILLLISGLILSLGYLFP